MSEATHTLVLYDGVCALCNRLVRFLLRHDHGDEFRFAPLQSEFGRSLLRGYGKTPVDLDTVWVVAEYGGKSARPLTKSSAVLYVVAQLGGGWRLSAVGWIIPHVLRDALYDIVARRRYRWFGKYDACPLPAEEERKKFPAM